MAQYHEMIRLGFLTDDDPVELLEGWLVTKLPKDPPHRLMKRRLRDAAERRVPAGRHVNIQEPISLETSEPEPDLALVRGEPEAYAERNPTAAEVSLAAKVSDTTVARDRGLKKRSYARARIPVYWLVNLAERQVEVYTQPSGPAEQPDYGERQDFGPGDMLPLILDGQEMSRILVVELFA